MTADAPLISDLPDALAQFDDVWSRVGQRTPAVFLDYDGVLTPIVDDPAAATLDPDAREALSELATSVPVAIISGRDLEDVRGHVAVDGFAYAGSHGFDMLLGDGTEEQYGTQFLDALEEADHILRDELDGLDGVRVERKRFAIAIHFRGAAAEAQEPIEEAVTRAVTAVSESTTSGGLRITGGKDIFELRPDIDWDKGRALARLMDVLELDEATHAPFYVGDDLTDEDGFAAITDIGVTVVVAGDQDRPSIAQYRLEDPAAVRGFLALLHERVRRSASRAEFAGHAQADDNVER